jgi:hypothetical protein
MAIPSAFNDESDDIVNGFRCCAYFARRRGSNDERRRHEHKSPREPIRHG